MIERVLMTADALGGVWTYALELARGLSERSVRTWLAVMGPKPSPAQEAQANCVPLLTALHANYKLEWMPQPWGDVDEAGEWLLGLEREIEPDIVHLNGYSHAAVPFRAPKLVVAHSCVLSWWKAVHGGTAPDEWEEYRTRVASGLHAATDVVAPSHAMLAALVEHYGPVRHARVIPNGRDPWFRPAAKEPFVLTAGRIWDQAKNVKLLEDVAAFIDWPVYAAGAGKVRPPVLGLGALAQRPLGDWFARAAIFALPALYEPFGLSVLEAAMSGCALVLGDIDSLRENWEDCALFASPHDPCKFTEQMQRLIEDGRLRSQFQRAALKRAARFSATAMNSAYLDCYAALVCRSWSATLLRS